MKIKLIDIKELIQELYDKVSFIDKSHSIELTTNTNTSIPFYGDKYRLSIVLANLISNGVKYSNPMISNSFIQFEISTDTNNVKIVYSDNGIGIKPEYIEDVFSMFFRATETNKGSGLGLYIVKEAIQKMKGSIELESEYGEWTRFTILLPNYSESVVTGVEQKALS